uniref:Uncharacterized protein n=1 Tax=Rhizophora mucronata TaxID=61149 RepID=A0A2P2P2K2_RHIMU
MIVNLINAPEGAQQEVNVAILTQNGSSEHVLSLCFSTLICEFFQ